MRPTPQAALRAPLPATPTSRRGESWAVFQRAAPHHRSCSYRYRRSQGASWSCACGTTAPSSGNLGKLAVPEDHDAVGDPGDRRPVGNNESAAARQCPASPSSAAASAARSRWTVGSSSRYRLAGRSSTRARAIRCSSPAETARPPSPRRVANPSGRPPASSGAPALASAQDISSSLASGLASRRLAAECLAGASGAPAGR